MTRMCFESILIYRGRKQDGRGWESGDKGTGSGGAGYGKRKVYLFNIRQWKQGIKSEILLTGISTKCIEKSDIRCEISI